ncbi:phosphoribulokinase/uridine kinase family protein [Treponema primitia ZAS-2]|uniref:Phosphoribulokinase/uridine kinase family protein n=1 Tax=Treponema primitia (strain ATCC BAA-887 / DSM 12427 / ZAS-2) TaxID=545694 RepID=F5YIY2_TREPZ|nr:nucleoside kinase [Treponema primitia]AEF86045.1 phosphoribulokinase/uridine kinase family protein [Treponema primitia ZAS-2]
MPEGSMDGIKLRLIDPGKDSSVSSATDNTITVQSGISVEELLDKFSMPAEMIAAVKINNQVLPLSTRIEVNAALEPVALDSPDGAMIYRRSLAFILALAGWELFPDRSLRVGHSLGNSYYYTFADEKKPESGDIKALEEKMKALAAEDVPIRFRYMAYTDALELFEKNRQNDTRLLLEQRSEAMVMINECKGFTDLYIEPLVSRTGILSAFELMAYQEGFLLRFPGAGLGTVIEPFEDSPGLFSVYREYKQWGRIIGVHSVGQLNRLVAERTIRDYIRIAETFQEKKLAAIADQIYARRDSVKAVLIAGPSSSGKTTTAKRLSIQLKVIGLEPVAISLDDYYVGTDKTPLDENGQPDFECLEALDIPYLNEQLLTLFKGGEVELPVFDFVSGSRREAGKGKRLRMGSRSVLVIEGIHGLNDALTSQIDRDKKFKVYVSALTQLNLDDHNRIPTSDNRLLRRIVRDYQFRGKDAAATIRMWPSVQQGARKYIFRFQEGADAAFNSALDYELAALKFIAEPQLRLVKPTMPEYAEASRLLAFLGNFAPIPPQYVPGTSILREFIGDSEFDY